MNSKICKLYIVRHGQSIANLDKVMGGDPELTDQGRSEAAQTKQILSDIKFDAVYSSDRIRAIETAEIISGLPVPKSRQVSDLRERSYGKLEEHPTYHQDHMHKALMALAEEDRWHYEHNGDFESEHSVSSRFLAALKNIGSKNLDKSVLVVAHGGCIRAMLIKLGHATFSDLPPRSFKNAGFVELIYNGYDLKIKTVSGTS